MNYDDAHTIIQECYFKHYSILTLDERMAFLIALLALPLVPQDRQNFPVIIAESIFKGR